MAVETNEDPLLIVIRGYEAPDDPRTWPGCNWGRELDPEADVPPGAAA